MSEIGRTRWGLVLALWVAGLGAAAQYGKISVVFDRMELLYPSAGAAIGFSVSMVGVVGLVLGVVAGVVVASLGYRRTIIVSLWLGAAMSLIQALHPPFALFLASRVVEGLSHLGLVVAVPTVIAQISLEKDRGTTLTLWSTFFGVAFALLVWFGLPVVERFGVPALFAVHCAIMAGLALALQGAMRSVPVPARQPFPRIGELAELHLGIYRSPWISAPAAGWVFYTMCFVSILTVLPAHIDPSVRAFVMGAMPLASIATSLTLGVWLMRVIPAVRVVILGFVLSAISMIWLWAAPGAPEACLGLACSLGLVQGASFAAVAQLNTTVEDRARANGVMAQAGNFGNTIGTPVMVVTLGIAGYPGMTFVTLLLFLTGALAHVGLASRRRALEGGRV